MGWHARSPDLNKNARQFDSARKATEESWREIGLETLIKLIESMPNRMSQVINRYRAFSDY